MRNFILYTKVQRAIFAGLVLLVASVNANAADSVSCAPYKAVYTPYPAYKRSDGIHYTLTIEADACIPPTCPAANVHLDTFDSANTRLTRVTMHYSCGGGDARSCYLILQNDVAASKSRSSINAIGLTSEYNQTSMLFGKPYFIGKCGVSGA